MTSTPGGTPLGGGSAASSSQPEQALDKTKQAASKLTDKATEQLRTQADDRTTKAGESVEAVANAFRKTGDTLRTEGVPGPAAGAVDTIADQVEKFGTYLRETDSDRMLHDIERFGRNKPWVIATAAMGAGFIASRFLKASSTTRYDRTVGTTGGAGLGYGTGYGYGTNAPGTTLADRDLALPPVSTRPKAGVGNGYSADR